MTLKQHSIFKETRSIKKALEESPTNTLQKHPTDTSSQLKDEQI